MTDSPRPPEPSRTSEASAPVLPGVVIVDDHPVVRAGLAGLITADGRLQVAGQAASGAECDAVVDHLLATGRDVSLVLMDLHLGEHDSGIDATRRLQGRGVPVLVVTTFDADADILAALDAGARGYVLKDSPTHELVDAALSAIAGRIVLSPEVQQRVLQRALNPADQLSGRETEILELLATGASNRDIARGLFISESTVKTHVANLFHKLGVNNRTALVATARERHLIR